MGKDFIFIYHARCFNLIISDFLIFICPFRRFGGSYVRKSWCFSSRMFHWCFLFKFLGDVWTYFRSFPIDLRMLFLCSNEIFKVFFCSDKVEIWLLWWAWMVRIHYLFHLTIISLASWVSKKKKVSLCIHSACSQLSLSCRLKGHLHDPFHGSRSPSRHTKRFSHPNVSFSCSIALHLPPWFYRVNEF